VIVIVRALVETPEDSGVFNRFRLGHSLAELIRRTLPLRYASLFTVTPDTELLEMLAVAGYTPSQEALLCERNTGLPLSIRIPDVEVRIRLLAGETVVIDLTAPRYEEQRRLYGITQVVLLPLRVGERFIGTRDMNPLEGVTLTERELALAENVAQVAALVIERDRLQREREDARAQTLALQEAHRRMDEFLGIASHDLRTPLTSLSLALQKIGQKAPACRRGMNGLSPCRLLAGQTE
jgi:signal transduction histidine kinase